jgi:hypothetical protein
MKSSGVKMSKPKCLLVSNPVLEDLGAILAEMSVENNEENQWLEV